MTCAAIDHHLMVEQHRGVEQDLEVDQHLEVGPDPVADSSLVGWA